MRTFLMAVTAFLVTTLGGCGSSGTSQFQSPASSSSNQATVNRLGPDLASAKKDDTQDIAFIAAQPADSLFTITPFEIQKNGDLIQSDTTLTASGQLLQNNTPPLLPDPKSRFLFTPVFAGFGDPRIRTYTIGKHGHLSLASDFSAFNPVTAMAVDPKGRYLFAGMFRSIVPLTISESGILDYVPTGSAPCDEPPQYFAQDDKGNFLYAAGFFRILSYSIDPIGRLVPIGSLPTAASVAALTSSPKSGFVFAAIQLSQNVQIQSYAIDGQGGLNLVGVADFPASATYLKTDPKGDFLYVGGNSLGVFPIHSDGTLGPLQTYPLQFFPQLAPSSDFLFTLSATVPQHMERWNSGKDGQLTSPTILPSPADIGAFVISKTHDD